MGFKEEERRALKAHSSSTYRFYPDNGQGRFLTAIAFWLGQADLKTAVFKASTFEDLQMLGNVYWSIFLRPDLALAYLGESATSHK